MPDTLTNGGGMPPNMQSLESLPDKYEKPTREEFYTNYPFYKYWKSEGNEKFIQPEGLNIYIHIPFCKQICDFCFYMKELVKSTAQVDAYVNSLCKEIEMVSRHFSLNNRKVNSIYMGGGTPSVLNEGQFKKIMETISKNYTLENPEFTLEAEPGTFTKLKLGWYNETGINRISMGIQSFVDEIIQLSSRKHTVQQALQSIQMIKDAGDFTVNIDLLSGLAGETMDTWKQTMDIALQQPVEAITIYKMKTYANTVFFKKGVHTNEIHLPDEEQEIQFFSYALEKIRIAGFQQWTNFAFTRNGYLHKYIENTWRGHDLIACGVSAFGKIGNFNYQNLNNIEQYNKKISEGIIPVYRTHELTYKDRIVKELLLCASRLSSYSKKEFMQKFGFDYFQLIPDTISRLMQEGFIEPNFEDIILTERGVIFGEYVGKTLAASVKNVLMNDSFDFTY